MIYSQEQYHSESFVPKDFISIKIRHLISEFSFGDFSSSFTRIMLISLMMIQSGLLSLRKPERIRRKLSRWVFIISLSLLFAILSICSAALESYFASSIPCYSSLLISTWIFELAFYKDLTKIFQRWVSTPF
jgi:putative effector of murein hydrolase